MRARRHGRCAGFGLVELLLAMSLASVLLVALIQVALAATGAFRLQHDLGALSHDARFAVETLRAEIASAGYAPRPWESAGPMRALGVGTADGGPGGNDQLELRRRSHRNCFGNPNPVLDATGRPRHDLRISRFRVNASGNLAWTCHYGPDESSLTRQVNGLGLVENVDAFQLRFAEDLDADGNAGRWVRAGEWADEGDVVAVQVGLVLAGSHVNAPAPAAGHLLGESLALPDDGRLRQPWVFTAALPARLK